MADLLEKVAEVIYECCRVEAAIMGRRIVPEEWAERDVVFRKQFVECVAAYMGAAEPPDPKEAHESWVEAYKQMGWRFGPTRDPIAKTHPDMVPFEQLPPDERQKDAVFLAFVAAGKRIMAVMQDDERPAP